MSNEPKTARPYNPFSCSYSPNVPELLKDLGCSLMISTYQAGKVIFLSAKDNEKLIQLPRSFSRPMGIALHDSKEKMAIALKSDIGIYTNSAELAEHYPKKPNTYDSMFMPRQTFHTGPLDIHDLSWGEQDKLYGVNTLFSCIVSFDHEYSFTPYWSPPFVNDMVSEDRCHLNGMAMENGLPKYATAFNEGNSAQSWRKDITKTGVMMDVTSNEIITRGLGMPHSPRLINGELYVLLSATGQLAKIDRATGKMEVLMNLEGFVRGMDHYNDLLFVGLSKLRKNSSTFAHLDIADKADVAGIKIIHLPSASIVGQIMYENSVDEIYDIQVLPNKIRPNIQAKSEIDKHIGVSTPTKTFWGQEVEKEKNTSPSQTNASS